MKFVKTVLTQISNAWAPRCAGPDGNHLKGEIVDRYWLSGSLLGRVTRRIDRVAFQS